MSLIRELANTVVCSSRHVVDTMNERLRELRAEDEIEGRKNSLHQRIVLLAHLHLQCNKSTG